MINNNNNNNNKAEEHFINTCYYLSYINILS